MPNTAINPQTSTVNALGLTSGAPANMTNDQLRNEWQTVLKQVQELPSDQRAQAEDASFVQLYRNGQLSAQDLDSLLTNVADHSSQVDPGKEAVKRAEEQAKAEGVTLTDQQKNTIAAQARQQAAQDKVADAERILDIERSALPPGEQDQALSLGVTVFDAKGNQQHLLVRNTGPGRNSIEQIHDLGDGYRDQVLIDAARDHLAQEIAATPPDQRKALKEKVHAPGGTYDLTLDPNGKFSVSKETGFWGSVLHGLEAIGGSVLHGLEGIAIRGALALVPGVGPALSLAYSIGTASNAIANGNIAGGLLQIAGGAAGVGGMVGGSVGTTIENTATAVKYGDQAYSAAQTGNIAGIIGAAGGAVPGLNNLASDLGAPNFGQTTLNIASDIGAAAKVGEAAQTGNIAGIIGAATGAVPGLNNLASDLGAPDFGQTTLNIASDIGAAAKVGEAAQQGNLAGVFTTAESAAAAVTSQITGQDQSSDY